MDINYSEIGDRIRKHRKDLGYTQAVLAEKVELSTEYICEIETGRKNASLFALTCISDVIGVSLDELLFGEYTEDVTLRAISVILKDCTEYERKVLSDNMKSLKLILRDNSDKL